jgi:hypothetical protein
MIRGGEVSSGRSVATGGSIQLTLSGSFQAGPGSGAASAASGAGAVIGTILGGLAARATPPRQATTAMAGAAPRN